MVKQTLVDGDVCITEYNQANSLQQHTILNCHILIQIQQHSHTNSKQVWSTVNDNGKTKLSNVIWKQVASLLLVTYITNN